MFQKFFTKTIESKFIKNLLSNTPLPIYKVVGEDDYIFDGSIYIYNGYIIKCTKSGYLGKCIWDKHALVSIEKYKATVGDSSTFSIATKAKIDEKSSSGQYINKYYLRISDCLMLDDEGNYYLSEDYGTVVALDYADTTLSAINEIIQNKFIQLYTSTYVSDTEREYTFSDILCTDDNSVLEFLSEKLQVAVTYANYTTETEVIKGEFIDQVKSKDYSTYPEDGIEGGYWYTRINSNNTWAEYSIISKYILGKDYPQFTARHISEYGYYDSETHENLGKYLNCLNKLYGLNLAPFYNCYSGRLANNFYLNKTHKSLGYNYLWYMYEVEESSKGEFIGGIWDTDADKYPTQGIQDDIYYERQDDETVEITVPDYEIINEPNTNFRVLQIPIKFNTTYTIAFDSNSEVVLKPAIIKNNRFVYAYNKNKDLLDLTEELNAKAVIKNKVIFRQPFTYRLDFNFYDASGNEKTNADIIEDNESNLYLLLQMSSTASSSVVILEGDYTLADHCRKYFDFQDITKLSEKQKDDLFISALSLLRINTGNDYAFSNRLIEYLTLNVITHIDEIDQNIVLAQESQNMGPISLAKGAWSDYIRAYYFNLMMDTESVEHIDINGYIDKNTEKLYVQGAE